MFAINNAMNYADTVNLVNNYIANYNYVLRSGVGRVAKVGNGWAQAQPIMSSAQPIFIPIVQPIYAPFHVKIYNK